MTVPETVEIQTPHAEDGCAQLTPEQAAVFEDVYEETHGSLMGYAVRLTRDHDEAEDLVQEAFARTMKAYGHREADRAGELHPILRRTVYNFFLDTAKKTADWRLSILADRSTPNGLILPPNLTTQGHTGKHQPMDLKNKWLTMTLSDIPCLRPSTV